MGRLTNLARKAAWSRSYGSFMACQYDPGGMGGIFIRAGGESLLFPGEGVINPAVDNGPPGPVRFC